MQKPHIFLFGVIVVLGLVGAALLGTRRTVRPVSIEPSLSSVPSVEHGIGDEEVEVGQEPLPEAMKDKSAAVPENFTVDEEVLRLQEFLDANDNESIVAQAEFLLDSEDSQRREEAIDALVWVSTPQAGMALVPALRNQDEETSKQAVSAMSHILSTLATQVVADSQTGELVASDEDGLSTEALGEAFDLWVAACQAVDNADDLEHLLIPLSGMEDNFSVPVLVELVETLTGEKREKAAEYLDMTTNRDGVTNREEAMLWLQAQQPQE
ncbi:MAG: HEAT repeat domain-containing protein [Victivallales bacterium]|nr:HEAT repeat domain-containing protein [Victivallales bacterium]